MDQNTAETLGTLTGIYRYPVKGFSPEPLTHADLAIDATLPFDRAYAIENGPGRFDPAQPRHLPKVNFLMLMRNARLATLTTRFNDETHEFTLERDDKRVATGRLNTQAGRAIIAQFVSAYCADDLRGAPRIVAAPGHSFSDVAAKCLHIVNLASLRELQRVAGTELNPLRFRPNLIVDTQTAWEEFGWCGHRIAVGDAHLDVFSRTERCAAVNVDPATGARDQDILAHLARNWGHTDFGVYAKVCRAAQVAPGAPIAAVKTTAL